MHEPPADLTDETIVAGLQQHYRIAVSAVTFLPLGLDAAAWVYRVQTAGDSAYFLKVRSSVTNAPSLLVPSYLHDKGVEQVVAPMPTGDGDLWARVAGYALILYPFISGSTGMELGMSPPQWTAYGAIARRIHDTPVDAELAHVMRHETFEPVGAQTVREVDRQFELQSAGDPEIRELAAIWMEQRATIHTLVSRAEALGQRLAQRAPSFVLCHADMHTNNVMLDETGKVWFVDWDETVLAPRERDLMFVLGGGISRTLVGEQAEALFLHGYGECPIDPLAISYYRYAWAVSDIGSFADEVVFRGDLSPATKRVSVGYFRGLFQPGQIVDLALESDRSATP